VTHKVNTARAVAMKAAADVITRGGAIIVFPLIARNAGAGGYGAYCQVTTITGFIVPFATLGLTAVLVRFFSADMLTPALKKRFLHIIAIVFAATALSGVLMASAAAPINRIFLKSDIGIALFRWGAPLIAAGALEQMVYEFLRARQRILRAAAIQAAGSLATIAAVVLVMSTGRGVVELVALLAAVKFSLVLFLIPELGQARSPVDWSDATPAPPIARFIALGFPIALAGFGLWMMNVGDRLVIGHFMTPADLGLYNAVYSMAALLVAVNAPFNMPAYPKIMRAVASGNPESLANEIRVFHRYTTMALVPAAVFLIIMIKPGLRLLGGRGFVADYVIVTLIVAALFLDNWNSIAQYILPSVDRPAVCRNAWIGAGILNVAANLVFVPLWGLRGAACVTFGTYLLAEVYLFREASRHAPLARLYRFDVLGKSALAAAAASCVLLAIFRDGVRPALAPLAAGAVIFSAAYLAALAALKGLEPGDLRRVWTILPFKAR